MRTTRLNPQDRGAAVDRLSSDRFDVLVVGGGIVGAACALDAVTRGLSVALIEADDWGSGHSSRTGRLVDGGLDRLPHARDVSESLRERDLLLERLAPHLVKRVPLLRPLRHRWRDRLAAGGALIVYDGLAALTGSREVVPAHRELARRTVLRLAPALDPVRLTGGVQRYEALVDDARLALTLVRTAVGYGATVASGLRATTCVPESDRVAGVEAYDSVTGTACRIRSRAVIDATGATDSSTGSDGIFLVVPRDRIRTSSGLTLPSSDGSPITVLPWGRHWILGPGRRDPADLLARVNQELAVDLGPADVESSYGPDRSQPPTESLTKLQPGAAGLVEASSPDLARYRACAARAVDVAVSTLGGLHAPSTTHRIALAGADGYFGLWNQRRQLADRAGLPVAQIEHLLDRYGSMVDEVLELLARWPELAEPLDEAGEHLLVEAAYAWTHEGARNLADVIERRVRSTSPLTEPDLEGRLASFVDHVR